MHHNKEQQKKSFKITMIDLCNCDLPIHTIRFLFVFCVIHLIYLFCFKTNTKYNLWFHNLGCMFKYMLWCYHHLSFATTWIHTWRNLLSSFVTLSKFIKKMWIFHDNCFFGMHGSLGPWPIEVPYNPNFWSLWPPMSKWVNNHWGFVIILIIAQH
jgi:hypothetical protein